MALRLIDS